MVLPPKLDLIASSLIPLLGQVSTIMFLSSISPRGVKGTLTLAQRHTFILRGDSGDYDPKFG